MAKAKKSAKIIGMPATPENQIRTRARNLPIGDCWITEDWEEMREANVLVTRKHNQGGITFAVYLIDLALLGLHDTFYQFNMPPAEFDDFIRKYTGNEQSVKIDYNFAHNLIYGAIAFAEEYDFAPHKDFSVSKYILEEDSEDIPLIELEFGMDGVPTIFTSPENQRIADIKKMERLVGKDNFHVIALVGEEDEDDEVDMDDVDDVDDWADDDDYAVNPIIVETYINLVDWEKIYRLCGQIFALKPWKKIGETDVFAIKLPNSGKEYFVSVMGTGGETLALAFYESDRGIYKFFELQDQELNYHPTFLLSIPHIMVSWEEKPELDPLQLAIQNRLGLTYTGKKVWPQIMQTTPGCFPEIPDIRSFKKIATLLEQSLEMLPGVIKDPSKLWEDPDSTNAFLFRIPKKTHGEWTWHEEFRIPTLTPSVDKVKYYPEQIEDYKRLPVKWKTLQVDVVLQPFPIQGKDGKLKFGFLLIALDPKTDLIVFAQVLDSGKRYETNLKSLTGIIMEELTEIDGRPAAIEFRNPDLLPIMHLFQEMAGTEIRYSRNLEPLGMAIIGLIDELGKNAGRKT